MKKFYVLTLLLLQFTMSSFVRKSEVDSLFVVLDRVLEESRMHVEQRERKIADYKQAFSIPNLTPAQQYDLNSKLYDLYYPFKPDSAVVYMKQNMRLAGELGDKNLLVESKLRLSLVYSMKSMFIDAFELIKSIPKDKLNKELLTQYYFSYSHLLSLYPHNGNKEMESRIRLYRDSLRILTDKHSPAYLERQASRLTAENKCEEARNILLELYKNVEENTHQQAMIAHSIAHNYRCEGNYEMQMKYFTIAAIADARNGIKENTALRALATACYETDDIERAYRYIYQSMEDAMFANVNFRLIEVSQIFPIIEKSYQQKVQGQRNRLYLLTACIGLLSLSLIVAMFYVMRQMKKLNKTRLALSEANGKLKQLNENLKHSNEKIRQVNKELSEANLLKETYISQFLTICSVYIRKLEIYQNSLNRKVFENKISELFRMLKSRDMIENELKELYNLFDTIFLDLYPGFINEFNVLLPESERFKPKANELLNTELRIFALIRLGIIDSSKIAEFLHYSLATVYNYRTRVRNKALIPSDEFEQAIMRIGVIQPANTLSQYANNDSPPKLEGFQLT